MKNAGAFAFAFFLCLQEVVELIKKPPVCISHTGGFFIVYCWFAAARRGRGKIYLPASMAAALSMNVLAVLLCLKLVWIPAMVR